MRHGYGTLDNPKQYTDPYIGMKLTHYLYLPNTISRSSQCSTTGVTKAVLCAILSVGWFI